MRRKILFNLLNEYTSKDRSIIKIFPDSKKWCISIYAGAFSVNWLEMRRMVSIRKGRGLTRVSFRFGNINIFGYNINWIL